MPNEIVNFPIQASAAGLMNKALVQLHEAIPLHRWGKGTGIINQCHDSIVVECPESAAKEVMGLLEECLNQTHESLPGVDFTASAALGKTWKEVG
jgi:DNA polymerase I-like protein with 3'-5' exonuclease and polymerase domains